MNEETWDIVVVGGGSAGLAAALLLARARRRVLVLDAGQPRNRFAAHMHGVLGHDGRPPGELLEIGRREVTGFGGVIREARATGAHRDGDELVVELAEEASVRCRRLLVTTGLRDVLPEIDGLAEQWGVGAVSCPYCHGYEVAGQRLGVLAGPTGDTHHVQLVRQWSERVTFFTGGLAPVAATARRELDARGITVDERPVTAVRSVDGKLAGLVLADGGEVALDALFLHPRSEPQDDLLTGLGAERTDAGPVKVNELGQTSVPGVWAAGNVVEPRANVPIATGAAAIAAGMLNADLIAEEIREAVHATAAPADFWEDFYREKDRVWSGRVNPVLAEEAASLPPGTALDVGCGEGGDAIWLAKQGWRVTAVDISQVALDRAAAQAATEGVADRIDFRQVDLTHKSPEGRYDLVSVQFFHSPVEPERDGALRRAAAAVAPGGTLLLVSHAAGPSWSSHKHADFPTADETHRSLELDPAAWVVETVGTRERETTGPDGEPGSHIDAVVKLRRTV